MKNNSHFRKGSGVVTCTICQRQTRETGNGESNYELCAQCIELSQMENRHADHNHAGEFWDCEDCIGDLSQQAKEYLDVYRKAQAGEVESPADESRKNMNGGGVTTDHNTKKLVSIISEYKEGVQSAQDERVSIENERQAEIKKKTTKIVESLGFKPPLVITAKEDDGAGYWFLIHEGQELVFRLWEAKHGTIGVQLSKWKCPDCGDYIFTHAQYTYDDDQGLWTIANQIIDGVPNKSDHECPEAKYEPAPDTKPKALTLEEKLGAAIREYVEGKILEYHSQQHEGW